MQNFPGAAPPLSSHCYLNEVHLLGIAPTLCPDSSQDSIIFPQSLIKADFFYFWDYAEPTSCYFVSPILLKLRLNLKSNTQTFYLIVLLQPTITIYYNNKTNFLMFSSFLALKKFKSHSLVLEFYKEYYMIYVTCG